MWVGKLVEPHRPLCLHSYHNSLVVMITSSNGNIFRVTGLLCEEFTGKFPSQRPVTRSFDVLFHLCLNKNGWVNNREADDLTRRRNHHDVTVMLKSYSGRWTISLCKLCKWYLYPFQLYKIEHLWLLTTYTVMIWLAPYFRRKNLWSKALYSLLFWIYIYLCVCLCVYWCHHLWCHKCLGQTATSQPNAEWISF